MWLDLQGEDGGGDGWVVDGYLLYESGVVGQEEVQPGLVIGAWLLGANIEQSLNCESGLEREGEEGREE